MEVSNQLVSWLITCLGDLQPTYIGVITHLLSTMDIPVGGFRRGHTLLLRSWVVTLPSSKLKDTRLLVRMLLRGNGSCLEALSNDQVSVWVMLMLCRKVKFYSVHTIGISFVPPFKIGVKMSGCNSHP